MGRDDVEVLCLARDTARDERYVTLRLLPLVMIRNAPAMDVLRDFAERAAAVRHPNLDEFLGLDRDPSRDDLVFLVSGYVTGRRLADLVAEAPEGLPVDDVLHWADQLADAIDHLHEHKLRHGAVNPHRVVIETSGRVQLTGATVWAETRRLFSELTGRVVGADPDYASPQQAAGIASAANDVYSLGATIYTALAGRTARPRRTTRRRGSRPRSPACRRRSTWPCSRRSRATRSPGPPPPATWCRRSAARRCARWRRSVSPPRRRAPAGGCRWRRCSPSASSWSPAPASRCGCARSARPPRPRPPGWSRIRRSARSSARRPIPPTTSRRSGARPARRPRRSSRP